MAKVALHGVNLSGWLSLKPWITPEYFAEAGVLDEIDMTRALPRDSYRELIEYHRAHFIEQRDFKEIAARGFNAVRLLVPWYASEQVTSIAHPFVPCTKELDNAFDWADDLGLKIVLVLDISPGKEGKLSQINHAFSSFSLYKKEALNILSALARRYRYRACLAAIELANDPYVEKTLPFMPARGVAIHLLRNYYREGYYAVRACAGDDVQVIMPDAHQPSMWRVFMTAGSYRNTALDMHLDHFSDYFEMRQVLTTQALIASSKRHLDTAKKSGFSLVIGSWCAALPGVDTTTTPEGRIALERMYTSSQLKLFSSADAWFFQTWKTQGRLSGWDARMTFSAFERRMISAS